MKKFTAVLLIVASLFCLTACDSQDYEKANALFSQGKYDEAKAIYVELGDYEDSAEKVKECDYAKACQLMEQEEPGQAAERFEALGAYKDSAEKLAQCQLQQIDQLIQGTWKNTGMTVATMDQYFTFKDGRVKAELFINGKSSLANEGDYRIDVKEQKVYICYDFIISTTGKKPNTEEKKLFAYTFDGENFVLKMDADGDLMEKM